MYWQLLLGGVSSFTVHGAVIGAINIIIPNVAMALVAGWTIVLVGRVRTIGWWRLFWVPATLFVALIGVDTILGAVVFGAAVAVPVSIGLTGQIVDIARQPDVSGVSLGFLVLGVMMQATWFAWGLLAVEWAVRVSSGAFLVLSLISLAWWSARRLGLPAVGRVPTDLVACR